MECMPAKELPTGPGWSYEIKFDGYRAQAVHTLNGLRLFSRNGKDFNAKFSVLVPPLTRAIPLSAAVDGELCALDEQGRPDFSLLQNAPGNGAPLVFYAFDLLALDGEDLRGKPLRERRRRLTRSLIESPQVQLSADADALDAMLAFVRANGLEGVVAKRLSSHYEPGERTGAWRKMRTNLSQEFVIGGLTAGVDPFDAILVGFYRPAPPATKPVGLSRRQYQPPPMPEFVFCASVRAGFVAASRRELYQRLQPLITDACPFSNLPEAGGGRFGQGLTASKMAACTWVWPRTVVRCDFLGWTPSDHLRHAHFVGVREDKSPITVVKES